MTSDDGYEPLSSKDFWELVAEKRGDRRPSSDSLDSPDSSDVTLSEIASIEERLAVAQSQGLAPNLRRQLAFVGAAESVFEFQSLGVRRYPNDSFDRSRSAHARGPEEAIALCVEADNWIAHGIYLLPARLRPGVEARHAVPGRWFDVPKGAGTTDSDVEARLVLAIDFDVRRPSGISATEEEMQRSVRVALNAWSYLSHHLGESSLAYLHSGNGRQIHVALDAIPTTDESKNAAAGLLAGLAHLFNTPDVAVDEKLYDPKRILPACGTLKKKGAPGVEERPHRRTAIVTPDAPTRVPLERLVELARTIWESADADGRVAIEKAFGVKPQTTSVVTGMRSNPDSPFGLANAVDPQAVAEWLGLYNPRGEVVCPGCGETSGVAVLNQGLKCHHNRCKDRGRGGFRTNIDLVAEVRRVAPKEAVVEISNRFALNLHFRSDQPPGADDQPAQQQGVAPPAPAPSPASGPFAYAPRFRKISTTEVFEPLPPINWLVRDLHLVAGRPTLIAGYGFSGKTLIAQAAMLGMASAFPVWGKFAPAHPTTVWHLDYEQGSYATKRRYQRLARGHGIPRDALGDRLQVTVFPDVYLDSPDAVDAYARAVEGVSVVALDALRGATPTMDENDSTIRRCLDNLTRISEKSGAAFIVLHHAGKTRDGETSDPRKIPRGSSAIFDACGCVFAIEGEKNDPKLVCQTKAPAEAEGQSLDDFYVAIEDVAGEEGPTAGLRVLYREGAETKVQIAVGKERSLRERIVDTVRMAPGQLTSSNALCRAVGGKKVTTLEVIRELVAEGVILSPADSGNGFLITGSLTGEPGTSEGIGVGTGSGSPGSLNRGTGNQGGGGASFFRNREPASSGKRQAKESEESAQRSQQSEEDASKLESVDQKWWKSVSASEGWSRARENSARAIAKVRVQKAQADGEALRQIALRGEDPRAVATEWGWEDTRIRAGMRFSGPTSKAKEKQNPKPGPEGEK